jgi:pimeloyl-ACP methyl ester carboxylesterase
MALDIKECIEEKELEELFIVGHSLGAKIAMGLISEFEEVRERVKGIVIGDMGCFDYL